MELLKSQKAQVFDLAKAYGFGPARLKWIRLGSHFRHGGNVPALQVIGTDFFFAFDDDRGGRIAAFSPGLEALNESQRANNIEEVLQFFIAWLQYLRRELAAPDPWAEIERQTVCFDLRFGEGMSESPFSVAEYRQVKQTLSVIQELLITHAKGNGIEHDSILAGIKRLEKAAENQDRKSWFQLVVGYLLSTATAMALDPEKTRALFTALKNGLDGVILLLSG